MHAEILAIIAIGYTFMLSRVVRRLKRRVEELEERAREAGEE